MSLAKDKIAQIIDELHALTDGFYAMEGDTSNAQRGKDYSLMETIHWQWDIIKMLLPEDVREKMGVIADKDAAMDGIWNMMLSESQRNFTVAAYKAAEVAIGEVLQLDENDPAIRDITWKRPNIPEK